MELSFPRQRRESDGGMTETDLRVVIVDDEPLARAVVREYLGAHPGVALSPSAATGSMP